MGNDAFGRYLVETLSESLRAASATATLVVTVRGDYEAVPDLGVTNLLGLRKWQD